MRFSNVFVPAVSAFALAASLGLANASSKTINASIWFPDTHPLTEYGYLKWAEKIAERSDGNLELNVYTGTVVLPAAGHLDGLRAGIVDIGYHMGTATPSDLPEDNLLGLLQVNYSDYFVTAFASTEMYLFDPAMQEQWERNGIVYIGGYSTPPYILMCNKPVVTSEDMRGTRIRTPGAALSDFAQFVGAVPVNVPSDEMYPGLDRGTLDCAANAANDLKSRSLWDVAKHVTPLEMGVYWFGYQYAANPSSWANLTSEERQIIVDTAAESIVETGQHYMAVTAAALEESADHGVTVHEPSEELLQAVEEFKELAREQAIEKGQSDLGLADPQGIVERFEAIAAKWEELLADVDREDTERLVELLNQEVYDRLDVATYGVN